MRDSGRLRIGLPTGIVPPRLDLGGRPVTVFGMARSGIAAAEFLVRHGAVTTVVDEALPEQLTEAMARLESLPVRLVPKVSTYQQLGAPELVVISPAVPVAHPLLQAVRAAGATVIGEMELAYRFCPAPLIAVTGTNGKGTTVTLIGDMLKRTGIRAAVGGNIGIPLISLLNGAEPPDVVVAEISSFQLETVELFRPWIGILLNISHDHRDRHPDLDEYVATKCRLFANQTCDDLAILNADDDHVAAVATQLNTTVLPVSLDSPGAAGRLVGGDLVIQLPGHEPIRLCSAHDLGLRGSHHASNALCAALAAAACGATIEAMAGAIRDFAPPAHLMQDAGTVRGVRFINDSKATNPAAAMADLRSVDGPVVLIAGGRAKAVDLAEFADVAATHARHLVLIGESAPVIAEAIGDRVPATIAPSLEHAVATAFEVARPGDTVLLAPGCASFDMFRDMAHRGQMFHQAVQNLARRISD